MKPIFEPGELLDIIQSAVYDDDAPLAVETIEAKLSSLGIDAETPEKLMWLESKVAQSEAMATRLDELEQLLSEEQGRVANSPYRPPLNYVVLHEDTLRKDRDRLAELERMIAEGQKK